MRVMRHASLCDRRKSGCKNKKPPRGWFGAKNSLILIVPSFIVKEGFEIQRRMAFFCYAHFIPCASKWGLQAQCIISGMPYSQKGPTFIKELICLDVNEIVWPAYPHRLICRISNIFFDLFLNFTTHKCAQLFFPQWRANNLCTHLALLLLELLHLTLINLFVKKHGQICTNSLFFESS